MSLVGPVCGPKYPIILSFLWPCRHVTMPVNKGRELTNSITVASLWSLYQNAMNKDKADLVKSPTEGCSRFRNTWWTHCKCMCRMTISKRTLPLASCIWLLGISKKAWTKAHPEYAGEPTPQKEISKQDPRATPEISTEEVNAKNINTKVEDKIDHLMPMKDKKLVKEHRSILSDSSPPNAASQR